VDVSISNSVSTTSYTLPIAQVSQWLITEATGDLVILDFSNGDPIPQNGGISCNGGAANDDNALTITGTTGSGSLALTPSQISVNGQAINYSNAVVVLSGTNTYTGGTSVSAGTLVVTASTALPSGGSLTVGAGGTLIFNSAAVAAPVAPAGIAADTPAAESSPSAAVTSQPNPVTTDLGTVPAQTDSALSTSASTMADAPVAVEAADTIVVPSSATSTATTATALSAAVGLDPVGIVNGVRSQGQGGSSNDLLRNESPVISGSNPATTTTSETGAAPPLLRPQQVHAGALQSGSASGTAAMPISGTTSAAAKDIVLGGLRNESAGSKAASWLWTVLDGQEQKKNKSNWQNDNAQALDELMAMMGR
jgi:fibronectin-binding autotransporter adhesin